MHQALFNFNDVALLLVITECLLLAGILVSTPRGKRLSNLLLAGFIIALGLGALDTLLYWCAPLKAAYFSESYEIFFLLKFTPFIVGPLLYWYVCSVIYTDFSLHKRQLWHLAPVVVYPFIVALVWNSLGQYGLMRGIHHYDQYFNNMIYRSMIIGQQASLLIYTVICCREILLYRGRLQQTLASLGPLGREWLRILVLSFLALWCWDQTKQVSNYFEWEVAASVLGLTGNYLLLLFVNLLVILSLAQANSGQGIEQEGSSSDDSNNEPPEAHVIKLNEAMDEHKPYLDSEITLEKLAADVGLTPRQVSLVINRHHKVNFYDYINQCRVDTAKDLLKSSPNMTMLDLMDKAGFNSKSSFNRLFKKHTDLTPSQFKKQP